MPNALQILGNLEHQTKIRNNRHFKVFRFCANQTLLEVKISNYKNVLLGIQNYKKTI